MKKMTLICFGKLKTPGLAEAVYDFTKRLNPYVDFKTIELKPIIVPEKSPEIRLKNQVKEVDLILKNLSGKEWLWMLDETGKSYKTTEWAKNIDVFFNEGPQELVFIIGSGLGLNKEFTKKAQKLISLGPQTMSHELARLNLVEQIYRSISYLKGHPYHNEG